MNDTIKILHIVPYNNAGGLTLRTLSVCRSLDNGFEHVVVVPQAEGGFGDELAAAGVDVRSVKYSVPLNFDSIEGIFHNIHWVADLVPAVRRIRNVIEEESPDVVHINEMYVLHAGLAAAQSDTAVVWHLIGTLYPQWTVKSVMPLVHRISDKLLLATRNNREYYGLGDDEFIVAPGFTDLSKFDPRNVSEKQRVALEEEFGLEEEIVITTVANVNPVKGLEYAIEALSDIDYPVRYLIAGEIRDQKYYEDLLQRIAEHGLGDVIKFIGFRDDIPEVLDITDIFLLPSLAEGTPRCVMEAMTMETAAIATDVGGISEILNEGNAGLIVESGSSEAIESALDTLLNNKERRLELADQGRTRVEKRYALDIVKEVYAEVYESCVKQKR